MSNEMNISPNGKVNPEGAQDEARELEQVGAFLRRWRDPAPDAAAKAALLETLVAEMEAEGRVGARHALPGGVYLTREGLPRRDLRWAWLILRAQVRLVHPVTWAASGLVIALGALVTLLLYNPAQTGAELPLVVVAPLVAACGVAFLYGLEADPALELQLATPVSGRLVLLARLALLFGFNLAITLVCSVGLVLAQAQITLAPLIAAWLAPMTFLSALAFLLSVIFFDSLASVLISLLIWVGATLRHFVTLEPFWLPDVLHSSFYAPMLAAAPALLLLALWLADHEERWTGGVR